MLIRRKSIRATLYAASIIILILRLANTTITEEPNQSSIERKSTSSDLLLFRRNAPQQQATINESAATAATTKIRIHVTAIHLDRSEFPLSKLLFKSTLRLALNELNEQLEQSNVKLTLSIRSANTCALQYASAIAAEEYYKRRARLFVLSGCDDAIRGVSRLASSWQIPVMTAAGFGADLNDKTVFKTLIRVAFSLKAAVEFLFKIMKTHQWRRVNLFVDESDPNSLALSGSIEKYATTESSSLLDATQATASGHQFDLNRIAFDLSTLTKLKETAFGGDNESVSGNFNNSSRTTTRKNGSIGGGGLNNNNGQHDRWPNDVTEQTVRAALRQSSLFSRVSILLIPQRYLRTFMLSVYDENMANGLYTFINMPLLLVSDNDDNEADNQQSTFAPPTDKSHAADLAPTATGLAPIKQQQQQSFSSTGENVFLWRSLSSSRNSQAKQAFESLMSIYLRTPTSKAYVYFSNKLINLANQNYGAAAATAAIKSARSTAFGENKIQQLNINPYSASFYDCLQIYSIALNESLAQIRRKQLSSMAENNNSTSVEAKSTIKQLYKHELHSKISDLIRNRRFENMVTGTVAINSNGDRETDFTLDDMNQMTGKFQQVILYRAETRTIERVGRIHWSSDPNVGPTSDTVDCNLLGTCVGKSRVSRSSLVMILATIPLAALLGGLFYFVQSKLTLESKLVDYWWRIHMSEIDIISTRRKHANDGSLVLTAAMSGVGGAGGGGGGGGANTDQSFVSSQLQAPSEQLNNKTTMNEKRAIVGGTSTAGTTAVAHHQNSLRNSSHQKINASTIVGDSALGGGGGCDKTTVTRATADTTAMASSLDVCYGNITLGVYKLSKVALKPISRFHQSRKLMIELRSIKDISHNNLCRFVGIVVDEGSMAIVSEFCPKGSLREFFNNESMVIDWTFKYSIINDILAGLNYLNNVSQLGFHGRLKSSNCLVSARFVVKLSDYGPHSLYEQLDSAIGETGDQQQFQQQNDEQQQLKKRIWLAPEHMRTNCAKVGSMKGDVYSFGLLLYEIITNKLPFFDAQKDDYVLPLKSLYNELKCNGPNESIGPDLSVIDCCIADDQLPTTTTQTNANNKTTSGSSIEPLVELMKSCWQFDAQKRPSLLVVSAALKKITRGVTSKKLLDNLTTRMEQYTNNLESLVDEKLAALVEEKLKAEELLYQFVPKSIASTLKEGQTVEPEAFDCVTVFYSDIVGFTSLSSESSPMEVVDFLSELYLCFDETLEQHDIFKVDTIGDAYIVASGLPKRNDGKHVVEIACAALELRERLANFKIRHKPDRQLEMRVGIHSGPCIAGIVGGLNMPKYCVFGDTLTIGKFMESTGLPMKIHLTEVSRKLLDGVHGFTIEPRTPKINKDGLPFQTYWLERDH